ncbi:MAG: Lrp/AsnC family transcriptional regulator, leucine-responsive regulatory protein [Chloroflexota bacterium]|jgi:Lrp/AsnC family leucine-responsive transcriptional regulator|nr:Lrp/AsnC family transcriptional regulator, leucine-responsive regulatory protein [Chloroflexota bacterium]
MTARAPLDRIDLELLALLQLDGRRPYAELGAEVGISGPSAHERVKKLEARRVIRGYTALVAPEALGYGVLAFTWLTQAPGTGGHDLTADFARIAEIEECHHIAGEADYLLKIRAVDTGDLGRIVGRLQRTPDVFSTETDVVFTSAFEHRSLGAAGGPAETDGPAGT